MLPGANVYFVATLSKARASGHDQRNCGPPHHTPWDTKMQNQVHKQNPRPTGMPSLQSAQAYSEPC